MDWSDSTFREHVKYFGDIEFNNDNIIGDNGIVGSKKYLAFRYNKKVGIVSTDFETNIDEKLAQGRKAEYGSKVYTTTKVNEININTNANVLQFNPFDDSQLFVGYSNGTLSGYNISANDNKCYVSINELSSSIYSIASHPSSSDIIAIGGEGNVNIIDLTKEESAINTKILEGDDQIIRMTYSGNSNYLRCVTKNKLLFVYDPRTDQSIENMVKLRYAPNTIVNLYGENQVCVAGLTSYLEPIVYAYDISGKLDDALHENYLFKQNYNHKQCIPFIEFDRYSQILYVTFQSTADVIAINTKSNFEKQALYHSVDDTFMAFTMLPKQGTKKREINKLIKFGKNRIQRIEHTRGGKLIYDKLTNSAKKSISTADDYLNAKKNISYPDDDVAKLVPVDFEETKKRSVSLYLHITGKEPLSNYEKYFDLKVSSTATCNLGLNVKTNSKYALFPAPTYGGGALGIIQLKSPGRKKQSQLSAHGEKITTFDICRIAGMKDW